MADGKTCDTHGELSPMGLRKAGENIFRNPKGFHDCMDEETYKAYENGLADEYNKFCKIPPEGLDVGKGPGAHHYYNPDTKEGPDPEIHLGQDPERSAPDGTPYCRKVGIPGLSS